MGYFFKLFAPPPQCPASVINLSNRIIQSKIATLLSKGLKYIPKPKSISKKDIKYSFDKYARRIKLTYFWHDKTDKKTKPKFKIPSNFNPPGAEIHPEIHEELKNLKMNLDNLKLKNGTKNSHKNAKEIKLLKNLQKEKNIIFKPADKGNSIIIENKSDYLKEANRQLNHPLHYKKLENLISAKKHTDIENILSKLKETKYLTEKEMEYFTPDPDGRPRTIYFLPKIHKNRTTWPLTDIPPGRPIISDVSSDSYNLSILLDHFLAPFSKSHPSYIKDSPHFLEKIRKLKPPPNCLLITLDVEALYTNIDNEQGLEAIKKILEENPDPNRPDKEFLKLLKISLENNDFTFNQQYFLQTFGTSMGKKFSPHYADIFMAHFEKIALSRCQKKPYSYDRFLDDIFIIWVHTLDDFKNFLHTFNNQRPNIKFKETISEHSIDFLDITIYKGTGFETTNILDTKVHFKETDTHELLHKTSYHPQHTFSGILKSQIIRFNRICNNKDDFKQACKTLFPVLHNRGYTPTFTKTVYNKTISQFRPTSSNPKIKPCSTPQCQLHPYLKAEKTISFNNKTLAIKTPMDCNSKNLIYSIKCLICQKIYIGQTTLSLRNRFNAHKYTIRHNKNKVLSSHINSCIRRSRYTNSIMPISLTPLETLPILEDPDDNVTQLINRETEIIAELKTYEPHGINALRDFQAPVPIPLKFSDNSRQISSIFKTHHNNLQRKFRKIFKSKTLTAHMRNKNLRDHLVKAKFHDH